MDDRFANCGLLNADNIDLVGGSEEEQQLIERLAFPEYGKDVHYL